MAATTVMYAPNNLLNVSQYRW